MYNFGGARVRRAGTDRSRIMSLGELVQAVSRSAGSSEEAAIALDSMFRTGRVRLIEGGAPVPARIARG